jgi:hypothetical protein
MRNFFQEMASLPKVEMEPEFIGYAPAEFLKAPVEYFEREGKNIKSGEIKYDDNGRVREDPSAVKDLPAWKNQEGKEIQVVSRRINVTKGKVGESGDPFYEYKILEKLAAMGLPAAKPIAKAEQNGTHLFVMERIPGFRWSEKENLGLKGRGFSDDDIASLLGEAEKKMNELRIGFEAAGVKRNWKLKDMVLEIDLDNKRIISVVPTDWERTEIIEKE